MPKKRLTALNGLTAQLRNIGAVMADPLRLKETVMLFLTLDGSGRLRKRYSITVSDIYLQDGTPFVADRFGNSAEASLLKVRDIDRLSWMVFRSTNPLRR